jgi:hypothetical protein
VAEVRAATSIDKLLEKRQNRAKIIFEEEDINQGDASEANSN